MQLLNKNTENSKNKLPLKPILIIYFAIIVLVFLDHNEFFGLGILLIGSIYSVVVNRYSIYILPCLCMPFMFLLRNQSRDSMLLAMLPDAMVLSAIAYSIMFNLMRGKILKITMIILVFGMISGFVATMHIGDLTYIPIIVRQVIMPVLFFAAVVNDLGKKQKIIEQGLILSIISFSIVSVIALLNYMRLIELNLEFQPLHPYLNFDIEKEIENNRNALDRAGGLLLLPRLNLLLGGSLGSSAAITFSLGIAIFLMSTNRSFGIKIIASLSMMLTSILTLSNSILMPVVIWAVFNLKLALRSNVLSITIILMLAYLISTFSLFLDINPVEYFMQTIWIGVAQHLSQIDFWRFIFGGGPAIHTEGFNYIPENAITDIGVFRVFDEYGLFVFTVYLIIILKIIKKSINLVQYAAMRTVSPYMLIFFVFVCLVHGNIPMQAPFYPLFAICAAGILARQLHSEREKP